MASMDSWRGLGFLSQRLLGHSPLSSLPCYYIHPFPLHFRTEGGSTFLDLNLQVPSLQPRFSLEPWEFCKWKPGLQDCQRCVGPGKSWVWVTGALKLTHQGEEGAHLFREHDQPAPYPFGDQYSLDETETTS